MRALQAVESFCYTIQYHLPTFQTARQILIFAIYLLRLYTARMEDSSNIYYEIQPVFFASRFIGLAPYTRTFQLSFIDCFATSTIILVTLLITAIVTSLPYYGDSTFLLILERGQVILLGLTMIVSQVVSFLNAEPLASLARNFLYIDKLLKTVNINVVHSSRFGIHNCVVRGFIIIPVIILDIYNAKVVTAATILAEYILIVPQLVTFVVEVQFMVLVHAVITRVLTMSRIVDALARKSYPSKPKKLMIMSTCHSTLVEMISTINNMFTVQMLLIMFTIFLLATAHLYKLIGDIAKTGDKDYLALLAVTLKVCLRTYEIWTITSTCVDAQDSIKEFNSALYQVLIEDDTGTLAENKKLQLHVSMKKEVVFTAYNFFPLDYTLVHSMVSAATTYLVILIQFGNTPK